MGGTGIGLRGIQHVGWWLDHGCRIVRDIASQPVGLLFQLAIGDGWWHSPSSPGRTPEGNNSGRCLQEDGILIFWLVLLAAVPTLLFTALMPLAGQRWLSLSRFRRGRASPGLHPPPAE